MRSDKRKNKNRFRKNKEAGTSVANADGTATKKRYRLNKKQFFKFLLALILVMIIGVAIFVGVVIAQAPKIDTDKIYDILTESTIIYDDNGKEIDTVYTEANRSNVEYKDLPENLVNAFVALEDKTFWDHHGFNFIRIFGAIKEAVFSGGDVSGTSTITQQLARNLFLRETMFDHSIKRKIIEAYYTIILEKNLTKEQIMEAYLNTINFGYNSNGVQAAAQAYFSKDVKNLTIAQCAALAALPQAPTHFQLVEVVGNDDVSTKDQNIIKRTSNGTYIANDASKERRITCLKLMLEQGYITQDQYDKASKRSLKKMLNPTYNGASTEADYFADYVINEVIDDLMEEKGYSYENAWDKVYNGGIKIHSTMDSQAQSVIENEFDNDANFPNAIINLDGNGNVVNKYGQVILYDYNDYFDKDGNFTFKTDEIVKRKDGSMIIRANKRLNIYTTEVNGETDYSIEFKDLYLQENGNPYSIAGGYINIPQQYKSKNKKGNVVISADFFKDEQYKDFFIFNDDGTVTIPSKSYDLNQKVIQPQAAMTIVENSTGNIKAMVGGRKTSGRMLYNRATSPRQPGSSIKPLGVYSAAIQQSAEEAASGKKHTFTDFGIDEQGADLWGNYLTAGSVVIDEKTTINGSVWPQNAGGGYSGPQTMRSALQQSINTCAVKIFLQVGASYSADLVKKFGISTIDTEGSVSDLNPAALALGGMTNGVTTLDMASAYSSFPNNGTRKDTSSYTEVLDSSGKKLLTNKNAKSHRVLDSGVAWIMTDMLKSVVTSGLGSPASISGVQAGGKTGTTDDQFDIWFDGFTPSYSASLWIGNDQNFQLTSMSSYAASLWGKIMNQISGAKVGSYKSVPSNVIYTGGEYYISGTQGGAKSLKNLEKTVTICTESGYLATPDCPHTEKKTYKTYGDDAEDAPKYYCNIHNSDTDKYPINPKDKTKPKDPVKPPDEEEPESPEKPEDPGGDDKPPVDPDNPDDPNNPDTPGGDTGDKPAA
ncbi:transglycosylase domain-containing protein [Emergencia sp.]|uniref:transglycosylase domain-containing protein n=1 Tax=Emergencia sp. TaxID=1926557 RepID=UPI003AF13D8D